MFQVEMSVTSGSPDFYQSLARHVAAITQGESDLIANLANISALLFDQLHDLNWLGFYIVRGEQLVLGPFQGKLACVRIDRGRGVCGTAWDTGTVQRVADVHEFPGHIACDSASASEIVLPIHYAGRVVAVLDLDSPIKSRFTMQDQAGLEAIVNVIETLDWSSI